MQCSRLFTFLNYKILQFKKKYTYIIGVVYLGYIHAYPALTSGETLISSYNN